MENFLSPEGAAEITLIHFSRRFGTNPLRPLAPRHLPPGTLLFAMVLEFTKMNGAGNDFVLIDNRAQTLHLSPAQIVRICDRHRGVGADGVMVLVPSTSGTADFAWEF